MGIELLSADCVIPAPMMSETKRQELVEKYRIGAWARGCVIEKEWRVRNPVLIKRGRKQPRSFASARPILRMNWSLYPTNLWKP